jgi:nudix-type nucleoside diphosphatase (YffH/AdpP family)
LYLYLNLIGHSLNFDKAIKTEENMQKVLEEKLTYEGFIKVQKGIIEAAPKGKDKKHYDRERINRENAAAVLIYNQDSDCFILTKQFRYAIHDRVKETILEIPAGKLSENEDPLKAAIRECEEECGYRIEESNIKLISSFFASPGYTTERYYLYFAQVRNENKISEGGGLEDENEYIELVEMPKENFLDQVKSAELADGKTYTAGLWYIINCL